MNDVLRGNLPVPRMKAEDLQAAIDKARAETSCYIDLNCCYDCGERYAHLDTLQAILNRHDAGVAKNGSTWCNGCGCISGCSIGCPREYDQWPCPDIETVAAALRKMGALE